MCKMMESIGGRMEKWQKSVRKASFCRQRGRRVSRRLRAYPSRHATGLTVTWVSARPSRPATRVRVGPRAPRHAATNFVGLSVLVPRVYLSYYF